MEQNRRPRIVRRAPLYKRIINGPDDWMMKVGNDIRALDWDMLQEGFSWPLAISLNMLLISVRMGYWLDDPLANTPTVLRDDRTYYPKSLRPTFANILAWLQYILVAISFINTIWLFQSKKNYKMLERDVDERPSASNVKMVEVQQDEAHWSFKFPGKYIYPFISPFMKGSKPQDNKRQVWEMSVWNPSILSRNLFCWYSPAQVLILIFMDGENFHMFFPLSIIVALQVHFLVSVYQSYVKDKQILFGEVQREYNAKFVHPRIFVRKFDKQVSTETDTSDLIYQTLDEGSSVTGAGSPHFIFGRKPRKFKHLSVPASRAPLSVPPPTRVTDFRGSSSRRAPVRDESQSSSSAISEDDVEENEEDEDEDEGLDRSEGDEDEEDSSDSGSKGEEEEEDGVDPDVDYDEEGEEPRVPHPINSL
ncbi:hypothetical protein BX616_006623 [Lobosporangium transversale]|uniref:Nuclear rim protein 1 n=1 Tax=Lobosporangium transversale TaxID=64571 RepID=A0A1Y2GM59_9FUNG|nr:hypothetical protein BCR41DRAFT_354361 [Lobosporangium transversale]KAF9896861.1 hypothetical protein BX616_006623 [Lobosporangium transversale]ORZ14941.1 hypothetical protein BCR41DRAFT_354361 [Lobosporangium transversale]|eukprot:XP_021881073.1 hypothetical protein BCR41DRAFT_354361 [Lobosporangium transversale]